MSVRVSPKASVERVRPRPRRRKRPFWRKITVPLLTIVIATVFALAAFAFLNKAVRPFKLYSREYQATEKLRSELESCRNENAALERRIKYLQTPEGRAQAARELGWVKPGEITLVLPPEGSGKPPATAAP